MSKLSFYKAHLICFLFPLLFGWLGCSEFDDHEAGGGLTFELQWPEEPIADRYVTARIPAAVIAIQVTITNAQGQTAVNSKGQPLKKRFSVNAGYGLMENIRAGSGYTVTFLAQNAKRATLYTAIKTNVTVTDNQVTDLGVIQMESASSSAETTGTPSATTTTGTATTGTTTGTQGTTTGTATTGTKPTTGTTTGTQETPTGTKPTTGTQGTTTGTTTTGTKPTTGTQGTTTGTKPTTGTQGTTTTGTSASQKNL